MTRPRNPGEKPDVGLKHFVVSEPAARRQRSRVLPGRDFHRLISKSARLGGKDPVTILDALADVKVLGATFPDPVARVPGGVLRVGR